MDNNTKAHDMLEEIYNLWTDISKDEEGEEVRLPGTTEEIEESREILSVISAMDIDNDEIKERFNLLKCIIDDYEETLLYLESPNGQVEKLLDEMFNLWSNVSEEDGTEYHSPANEEEINRSWELIDEIEDWSFDDEEIGKRLETYRNVLKTFESEEGDEDEDEDDYEEEESEASEEDIQAFKILDKIYNLWSTVTEDEDDEYRSPKNIKEIKKSRALMRKIKTKKLSNQYVLNRKEELESVLDSVENIIPNYNRRIMSSILLSLFLIIGYFFWPISNQFTVPEYDYNTEWFTTEKGGNLNWLSIKSDEKRQDTLQTIFIEPGTKLKPLGSFARFDLQVETPDGQRGFIDYSILWGARFVEARDNVTLSENIGDAGLDSVASGTKATILEQQEKRVGNSTHNYIKVRLEDGREGWANDYQFNNLILENIPIINQTYKFRTTPDVLRKNIIGKPLAFVEKHYGPASSHIFSNNQNQAYFRHLIVVDNKKHHKGVMLRLDTNNKVDNFEYKGKGTIKTYDRFPLVNASLSKNIVH